MNESEVLLSTLRKAGMRITPQRITICRLLCETDSHPTANEIFEKTRRQFPSLALATVYNTLDVLVRLGAIHDLGAIGDGHIHFDADTSPHVNLACVSCHRILDIESTHAEGLDQDVSSASGFRLLGARVMYYGLCPDCQQTQYANTAQGENENGNE